MTVIFDTILNSQFRFAITDILKLSFPPLRSFSNR